MSKHSLSTSRRARVGSPSAGRRWRRERDPERPRPLAGVRSAAGGGPCGRRRWLRTAAGGRGHGGERDGGGGRLGIRGVRGGSGGRRGPRPARTAWVREAG